MALNKKTDKFQTLSEKGVGLTQSEIIIEKITSAKNDQKVLKWIVKPTFCEKITSTKNDQKVLKWILKPTFIFQLLVVSNWGRGGGCQNFR